MIFTNHSVDNSDKTSSRIISIYFKVCSKVGNILNPHRQKRHLKVYLPYRWLVAAKNRWYIEAG